MESILSVINIQQIVNFVTVVEQNGFRAASDFLHMEQSSVSKSIWRLEESLGFPLFTKVHKGSRTFREAKLTEQGEFLYKNWAPAIREIEEAYRHVLRETDRSKRMINIGYTNTSDPELYLWPVLNEIENEENIPEINVDGVYRSSLLQGLTDEIYDMVFVPDIEYYAINQALMNWKYVAVENAQILVPGNRDLYEKESLTVEELKGESFMLFNDGTSESPNQVQRLFFESVGMDGAIKVLHKDAFNVGNAYVNNEEALILTDAFFKWGGGSRSKNLKRIPLKNYYNGILCVWRKSIQKEKAIKDILKRFPDQSKKMEGKIPIVQI